MTPRDHDSPTAGVGGAHPDVEALSAFIDGEEPEARMHASKCPQCMAVVSQMRSVRALLAAAVPGPSPMIRERLIDAALTSAQYPTSAPDAPLPAPSRLDRGVSRWMAAVSAAAVALAVLATAALLSGNDRSTSTTAMRPSQTADGGRTSADAGEPDLGEVGSPAELATRLLPVIRGAPSSPQSQSAAAAAQDARSYEAGPEGRALPPPPAPPAHGGAPSRPRDQVIPGDEGTANRSSCEAEARIDDASLGPVIYRAHGTSRGIPVIVLGFAPVSSQSVSSQSVRLAVLAVQQCRLLFETTLP